MEDFVIDGLGHFLFGGRREFPVIELKDAPPVKDITLAETAPFLLIFVPAKMDVDNPVRVFNYVKAQGNDLVNGLLGIFIHLVVQFQSIVKLSVPVYVGLDGPRRRPGVHLGTNPFYQAETDIQASRLAAVFDGRNRDRIVSIGVTGV